MKPASKFSVADWRKSIMLQFLSKLKPLRNIILAECLHVTFSQDSLLQCFSVNDIWKF